MSLLITSVLVAGGVFLGRWIARGGRPAPDDTAKGAATEGAPEDGTDAVKDAHAPPRKAAPATTVPAADLFAEMPCALGDVVMRGGDEAWLAGGIVFIEDHPVSALFVAPEAGTDRAVYVRARPSGELYWLSPVPAGELTIGSEPPTSLEHGTVRFDRLRRLPVKVQRAGSGAPDVGDQVIVAEYASSGFERLVVVTGAGTAHAWVGSVLEEGMYEILPSGKSTLES